ncbi:MAG: asparagine synthase (glutamine-hydrolyzing), partial [Bacteroidota bacterium]
TIGEKPLYYAKFDNTFIFGSEIKSILAYGMPREIATEMTEIFLTFGYMTGPQSYFKNILKIQPGHFIIVNENGFSDAAYWEFPQQEEKMMLTNKQAVYEEFDFLLKDSVRLQMRSDVPYGAFLSGGLDSSSVVAIMSELSSYPVETFTIGFDEKAFDERKLAQLVADKFSTNHHAKTVQQESFNEALNKVVYHYDEPFGDSSAIPTGCVSKYASEKVKMVLTGDGGDEVLSGYQSFIGLKLTNHYRKLPPFLRQNIPPGLGILGDQFRGDLRYKFNRLKNVCQTANLDFIQRSLSKLAWISINDIKMLMGDALDKQYPAEEYLSQVMSKCSFQDDFYKMMYMQFHVSLPDDMLVKVDRMSLAHSLEARVPFLDHRLIEFMVKVHKDVKLPGFNRKNVLKNTVGRKLPEALYNAPKKGFEVPVREWFKKSSFNPQLTSLSSDNFGLNQELVKSIIEKNSKGETDYGNFIWMLFVLKNVVHPTS